MSGYFFLVKAAVASYLARGFAGDFAGEIPAFSYARIILRWCLVPVLAVSGLLVGCAEVITVPVDSVTVFAEDRPLHKTKDDIAIKASILKGFAAEDFSLLMDVNTDVYESDVMLTGSLKKSVDRQKAVELAQRVNGVKNLYNDIQVTDKGGFGASATDISIELSLSQRLLDAEDVGSINLRWRSVNGVVYYIGQVHSKNELEKVLQITRAVKGVKNVVSHIRINLASSSSRVSNVRASQ